MSKIDAAISQNQGSATFERWTMECEGRDCHGGKVAHLHSLVEAASFVI